jgi:hypothetical protein
MLIVYRVATGNAVSGTTTTATAGPRGGSAAGPVPLSALRFKASAASAADHETNGTHARSDDNSFAKTTTIAFARDSDSV